MITSDHIEIDLNLGSKYELNTVASAYYKQGVENYEATRIQQTNKANYSNKENHLKKCCNINHKKKVKTNRRDDRHGVMLFFDTRSSKLNSMESNKYVHTCICRLPHGTTTSIVICA
uniref:Uncharacterized protein n=1 Tax=Glossina pallidipes TaxID=7398 RepID=A0A1B0A6M1_GLOPL